MKRLDFDILDENHDVTAYERHYTSSLLSTRQRRNSSPAISTSWPQPWSRGQASAYDLRNTLSELCNFHSQSQGMCWHFRTALETISTQIRYGGKWSASRAIENYWTLLESEFDSGSTSHLSFDPPGIWQHDRNHIVATNAQNNYILFEFGPSFINESWTDMHAESTQVPTCWQAS